MRLVIALAFVALPALAQSPSEFRASAPLVLARPDALHQVEIPLEVYRDARGNLADVRVYNAAGESVPIAWAGPPKVELESQPPFELPIFPVSRLETEPGKGSEVTIRTADGTLVSVKGGRAPAKVAKPAAYLLDASQTSEPIRALIVDWDAVPGSEVVTVRVDSSDDLKTWSPLAAAPVVRVESGGRTLLQPRLEFTPRKVKYFRIKWDAPGFTLASVRAEYEPHGKPTPRRVQKAVPQAGKDGGLVYDLGARLPVEAFRLVPPQQNAVVSAVVSTRDDEKEPWSLVATAAFYRLQRDGAEVSSPMLEIGRRSARYWMVRLAAGSTSGAAPELEVEWSGARLIFVAQGEGPYSLAFGSVTATPTALPVATIIPRYEKGAELALPEARVGAVVAGPPPTRWEGIVGRLDARRITLWVILASGVVVLGVMAWRLKKRM